MDCCQPDATGTAVTEVLWKAPVESETLRVTWEGSRPVSKPAKE